MTVAISTVYTFDMPTYVYIKMKGREHDVRIQADQFERDGEEYRVIRDGKEIGRFRKDAVDGWYFDEAPR